MLRRPISINFVDRENNQLWLLVAMVGDGTRQLGQLKEGDVLNCMLPLGNGFTMPTGKSQKYLLRGPARWAHSLPKYPTRCSLCITF